MIINTHPYVASFTDDQGFHSHMKPVVAWNTETGEALVVEDDEGRLVPARNLDGFFDVVLESNDEA